MSEESNFSYAGLVSFDRFQAFDIRFSYLPERWQRTWPTYVAMVFPYPDPLGYIESLAKPPFLESAIATAIEVRDEPVTLVSLLFDGLLSLRGQGWQIIHPRYPTFGVPIADDADIFLADSKTVSPDSTLMCLRELLKSQPPSVLVRPVD